MKKLVAIIALLLIVLGIQQGTNKHELEAQKRLDNNYSLSIKRNDFDELELERLKQTAQKLQGAVISCECEPVDQDDTSCAEHKRCLWIVDQYMKKAPEIESPLFGRLIDHPVVFMQMFDNVRYGCFTVYSQVGNDYYRTDVIEMSPYKEHKEKPLFHKVDSPPPVDHVDNPSTAHEKCINIFPQPAQ